MNSTLGSVVPLAMFFNLNLLLSSISKASWFVNLLQYLSCLSALEPTWTFTLYFSSFAPLQPQWINQWLKNCKGKTEKPCLQLSAPICSGHIHTYFGFSSLDFLPCPLWHKSWFATTAAPTFQSCLHALSTFHLIKRLFGDQIFLKPTLPWFHVDNSQVSSISQIPLNFLIRDK